MTPRDTHEESRCRSSTMGHTPPLAKGWFPMLNRAWARAQLSLVSATQAMNMVLLCLFTLSLELILVIANSNLFPPSSSKLLKGHFIGLAPYLALHLLDLFLSIDSLGGSKV
jgi:hypothetical protein